MSASHSPSPSPSHLISSASSSSLSPSIDFDSDNDIDNDNDHDQDDAPPALSFVGVKIHAETQNHKHTFPLLKLVITKSQSDNGNDNDDNDNDIENDSDSHSIPKSSRPSLPSLMDSLPTLPTLNTQNPIPMSMVQNTVAEVYPHIQRILSQISTSHSPSLSSSSSSSLSSSLFLSPFLHKITAYCYQLNTLIGTYHNFYHEKYQNISHQISTIKDQNDQEISVISSHLDQIQQEKRRILKDKMNFNTKNEEFIKSDVNRMNDFLSKIHLFQRELQEEKVDMGEIQRKGEREIDILKSKMKDLQMGIITMESEEKQEGDRQSSRNVNGSSMEVGHEANSSPSLNPFDVLPHRKYSLRKKLNSLDIYLSKSDHLGKLKELFTFYQQNVGKTRRELDEMNSEIANLSTEVYHQREKSKKYLKFSRGIRKIQNEYKDKMEQIKTQREKRKEKRDGRNPTKHQEDDDNDPTPLAQHHHHHTHQIHSDGQKKFPHLSHQQTPIHHLRPRRIGIGIGDFSSMILAISKVRGKGEKGPFSVWEMTREEKSEVVIKWLTKQREIWRGQRHKEEDEENPNSDQEDKVQNHRVALSPLSPLPSLTLFHSPSPSHSPSSSSFTTNVSNRTFLTNVMGIGDGEEEGETLDEE